MVARLSTTELIIELIREGRLVDAINCSGPLACVQQACVLIGRQGALEAGDIILVRDFEP
jgi:hypothetical protein